MINISIIDAVEKAQNRYKSSFNLERAAAYTEIIQELIIISEEQPENFKLVSYLNKLIERRNKLEQEARISTQ